jgi:hypothetical protein
LQHDEKAEATNRKARPERNAASDCDRGRDTETLHHTRTRRGRSRGR